MSKAQAEKDDLHGNVPERAGAVLLLVDVINDLEFPRNENLLREAPGLGRRIRELKARCQAAGIPTIYVNDNFGKWRSDMRAVVEHALREGAPGREFVRMVVPGADDYVVLKPKHSAFFATPLEVILEYLGAHTVIMAGITTNACVLISAGDLFVRGWRLVVPRDCVAALTDEAQEKALHLLEESYGADTTEFGKLDLEGLKKEKGKKAA